jgi:hypothetical protein
MFSSKSNSSSTTSMTDNSRNLVAETGGILASEGGFVNQGVAGDYILNYDMGADVAGKSLDIAGMLGEAMAWLAGTTVTESNATTKAAFDNANAMVENNARLAGQSMDTALAFAQNAKPTAATYAEMTPYIAGALALGLIGWALVRKH